MSDTLTINEIYLSIQGESTFAGLPCIFVRLTACNLRCSYCDTAYAFTEGSKKALTEIRAKIDELAKPFSQKPIVAANVRRLISNSEPGMRKAEFQSEPSQLGCYKLPLIELTGGEPLLQKNSLPLMKSLCDDGFTVLIETSGALDISQVDPRVRRIMDLKCPSSGESERNRLENIRHLKNTDEIKFVIGTQQDYDWAKQNITEHQLSEICPLLFSWVAPLLPHQQDKSLKKVPEDQTPISRKELVDKIITDALPVRFQLQMHKFIWPPDERGV